MRMSFSPESESKSVSVPVAVYAIIIIGTTVSLAGKPSIKAVNMTPSSPMSFANGSSAPEKADALIYQFLRNEGVVRSYHPLYSFAAWGKYAKILCDKHPLHFGLNQDSPLGKVSEFNGATKKGRIENTSCICTIFYLTSCQVFSMIV